jgi:hypothetical protein
MCARFLRYSVVHVVMSGLAVAVMLGTAPASSAQPMTKQIEYLIHETPTDPNSPVEFQVTLSLEESDQDGNFIGWDITSLEIEQVVEGGANKVWLHADPNVPTQDGLWWVRHADPNDPTNDEFTVPPHLQGTAGAQDPGDDDLQYDIEGKPYVPPAAPEQPPYEITAALDYTFTLVGDDEPIGTGEDEPVDVPPDGTAGGGN